MMRRVRASSAILALAAGFMARGRSGRTIGMVIVMLMLLVVGDTHRGPRKGRLLVV